MNELLVVQLDRLGIMNDTWYYRDHFRFGEDDSIPHLGAANLFDVLHTMATENWSLTSITEAGSKLRLFFNRSERPVEDHYLILRFTRACPNEDWLLAENSALFADSWEVMCLDIIEGTLCTIMAQLAESNWVLRSTAETGNEMLVIYTHPPVKPPTPFTGIDANLASHPTYWHSAPVEPSEL